VAEYTCEVAYARDIIINELIFKVHCYATTSVYQKLLDFFTQLTNTNKHLNTG